MSIKPINNKEAINDLLTVWRYIQNNGSFYILIYESPSVMKICTEEDHKNKRKIVRVFVDIESAKQYVKNLKNNMKVDEEGEDEQWTIKAGTAKAKLLKKQLNKVYGSTSKDGFIVECILTSYDELGNMHDVDIIWTQQLN